MTDLIVVPQAAHWQRLKRLVLDSVSSPITRRVYNLGLDEFFEWYGLEPRPGFTKATVCAWRVALEARELGTVSINVRITAVRRAARRNHTGRALLNRQGRGQRHAMTAEDVHHFRGIGRAAGGGGDYLGGFSEVRGAHYRRGYDGELFHILTAEIIEAVHRASGDAQRLPGTNLDGLAVNRPGKDALDTVEDLLVGIVLVGRRRQLLPNRNENLEH